MDTGWCGLFIIYVWKLNSRESIMNQIMTSNDDISYLLRQDRVSKSLASRHTGCRPRPWAVCGGGTITGLMWDLSQEQTGRTSARVDSGSYYV